MDYCKELQDKLEESYHQLIQRWMASTPEQLIEAAEEISAAQFIYHNLADSIHEEDAAFLFHLDDPLKTMTGKWIEENGWGIVHDEEIRHCIYSLREETEEFCMEPQL